MCDLLVKSANRGGVLVRLILNALAGSTLNVITKYFTR